MMILLKEFSLLDTINTINTINGKYMDFQLDEVKIMQCKECGVDVPVNINYPINEVTCLRCWAKKKAQEPKDGLRK